MPYEHNENYFGMAAKVELEAHPERFIINIAEVEAMTAKTRKERAAQNPPKPVPARLEYEALRRQLYNLQQNAKNSEIKVNNEAANVSNCLTLISGHLKSKKVAAAQFRLGDERSYEHRLVAAESELKTFQAILLKSQRNNEWCVRELSNFDGHARIAELQTELGL